MTENKTLTSWFNGKIQPARPGVYERKFGHNYRKSNYGYAYWDGKNWCSQGASVKEALSKKNHILTTSVPLKWRGLAEPPHSRRPGLGAIMDGIWTEHPRWSEARVRNEALRIWHADHRRPVPLGTLGDFLF